MEQHSNEQKNLLSEVGEGATVETQRSDIPVDQVRRDQSDSSSDPEYTSASEGQNGRKKARREEQGSSYEGHPEDQHHTEFHSDVTTCDYSTSAEKSSSTFITTEDSSKDESTSVPSEEMQSRKEDSSAVGQAHSTTTSSRGSSDKGVTGLANMRNTCYMNAVIQALRHNTEISAFFLENRHNQWVDRKPGSPKVELVKAYADLLKSLWSGSRPSYVRPQGFLHSMIPAAIASGFEQFQVPLQHDSHEFLTFLLDQLHEGMAEEVNIEINRPTPITEQDHAIQQALEAWKRLFGKQYSPFTEMVYGLLRVTMTCETCKHKSNTWEPFNCLKLPVPTGDSPATIEAMMKDEFKSETIEGYACDKCSPTRTTATRQASIWRLPRMMSLVLKRFTPDGRKIYTNFTMPANQTVLFKDYFSPDSPEPSQHQPYECFATVDHHGSSGGGHYNAQAKSPLTEKWHLFDDETANFISEPHYGISTYILFFKPSSRAMEA
jgi:ubiquitin C-terminal hydrolase